MKQSDLRTVNSSLAQFWIGHSSSLWLWYQFRTVRLDFSGRFWTFLPGQIWSLSQASYNSNNRCRIKGNCKPAIKTVLMFSSQYHVAITALNLQPLLKIHNAWKYSSKDCLLANQCRTKTLLVGFTNSDCNTLMASSFFVLKLRCKSWGRQNLLRGSICPRHYFLWIEENFKSFETFLFRDSWTRTTVKPLWATWSIYDSANGSK